MREWQNESCRSDGIKHDFKTRQLTLLGNYRNFITRQIAVEGAGKIAGGQKGKAVTKSGGKTNEGTSGPDILARTAIRLEVK